MLTKTPAPAAPPLSIPAGMRWIPAGSFLYGSKGERRTTQGFAIDEFPVTNSKYLQIAQKYQLKIPRHLRDASFAEAKANHPVVGLTQREAAEFCIRLGCDLPTEEEWQRAARGDEGFLYPWGNDYNSTKCNTRESARFDTSPVDDYKSGRSPFGIWDMAGNVWEWTSTAAPDGLILVKGGSWFDVPAFVRCDRALTARADFPCSSIGFRCIWRPDDPRASDATISSESFTKDRLVESTPSLIITDPPAPSSHHADAVVDGDVSSLFAVGEQTQVPFGEFIELARDHAPALGSDEITNILDAVLLDFPAELQHSPESPRALLEAAIARGDVAAARTLIETIRATAAGSTADLTRLEQLLSLAETNKNHAGRPAGPRRAGFVFWMVLALLLAAANVALYWARTSGRI